MSAAAKPLGALILHGLTSSLDCVSELEPRMQQLGVPYRIPILRGHCTRPEDLVGVTWRDWIVDAERALDDLLGEVDRALVVGLSMGGLVALWLAVDHPSRLAGVVAIAPALRLADPTVPLAPVLARVRRWVDVPMRAYADPELARLNTNYTRMPITAVQELVAMQRAVEPRLSELRVPLLVLGARRDRVVRPSSVATVHRRAGSADKRLVWFERSGHEMLRDLEREAVMDLIGDYLSEPKAALATGRPDGSTLINPWMTSVRYAAIGRGHYESFYLKDNHPSRRLGVWLKFNLLEPVGAPDRLEGELWGVWFDGETGKHVVAQRVLPREGVEVRAGATMLRLGDAVLEHGRDALVERAQITGGDHQIAWDVRLEPMAPPVVHFPSRRLYEGGFPRKKILTPIPRGRLDGWIEIDGNRHVLDGWEGLHGHNWGREHAPRYAYGNGVFADGAYVDGFSARVRLGPVLSPWLSMLVVRLPDGRELPFNRPARWLSGHPLVDDERWEVDLPGQGRTRLRLAMTAPRSDMVVLSYRNPDGQVGLCANTKFARGHLRVEERGQLAYEGSSERCELETFAATPRK